MLSLVVTANEPRWWTAPIELIAHHNHWEFSMIPFDRLIATRTDETRDAGMSTAEYAIGTVAACAFAAVLYKVVTSTQILDLLSGVVSRALHVPF